MKTMQFDTLEDAIECYGRENLVAINTLKQIIFYVKHGCQPKFIWENEKYPGRITAWFLRSETTWVYKRWTLARPEKDD